MGKHFLIVTVQTIFVSRKYFLIVWFRHFFVFRLYCSVPLSLNWKKKKKTIRNNKFVTALFETCTKNVRENCFLTRTMPFSSAQLIFCSVRFYSIQFGSVQFISSATDFRLYALMYWYCMRYALILLVLFYLVLFVVSRSSNNFICPTAKFLYFPVN